MNTINALAGLELSQIGWVVPDIHATVKFLTGSLGVSFPEPEYSRGQDLKVNYYGKVVDADWLTTQIYHGGVFIELIQPLTGQSIFHDYLVKYPLGGTQHLAFRLPVSDFEKKINELTEQGYGIIGTVDHPVARMAFFDTYQTMGVATEIMGVTPEGAKAIEEWKKQSKYL